MNKNIYFIFIAASFALLVSAPGRIAYGLVLIVEMNILAVSANSFSIISKKWSLGNLQNVLTLSFVVFVTVLYKQLVILFSPILALNLGFVMYIVPISLFLFGNIFDEHPLAASIFFKQSIAFSTAALMFFLLRDIFGYGTISFPVRNGIAELHLFDSYSTAFFAFFASIPGTLLLTLFCMAFLLTFQYKINIMEKAGELQ